MKFMYKVWRKKRGGIAQRDRIGGQNNPCKILGMKWTFKCYATIFVYTSDVLPKNATTVPEFNPKNARNVLR